MTDTQGKTGTVFAVIAIIGVLGACSTSTPDRASGEMPSTATAPDARTATAPAAVPAMAATTPACGTPPRALEDRASVGITSHPGAITATTYVFAATTDTGDWYVLGLDRDYVHDDGSPVGEHSRSLALTNPARATDGEVAMIPLSLAVSAKLPVSWERVSWTGETLAAGKRAAERAIACLDEQRQ